MVHQSCDSVIRKGEVLTLYCVASHHSLNYTYTWDNLDGEVGMHSPIYYASKPGVYRCTIDDGLGNTCNSACIFLTESNAVLFYFV